MAETTGTVTRHWHVLIGERGDAAPDVNDYCGSLLRAKADVRCWVMLLRRDGDAVVWSARDREYSFGDNRYLKVVSCAEKDYSREDENGE